MESFFDHPGNYYYWYRAQGYCDTPGMIIGGFSGAGILIFYYTQSLTPGIWYFILNIPVFILGWIFISRRFLFYSLYGAVTLTLAIDLIQFKIPVKDLMLASLAGGTIIGAGAGIVFRSLGSAGGNDIISTGCYRIK